MARLSWPLRAWFRKFDRICIENLIKIGLKKDLLFLSPPLVLDVGTQFPGYDQVSRSKTEVGDRKNKYFLSPILGKFPIQIW